MEDNGGMSVVRLKPLGAGGCCVESSAESKTDASPPLTYNIAPGNKSITVYNKTWSYPKHVIPPTSFQEETYDKFVPVRIQSCLEGFNVSIMAAGAGEYGTTVTPNYGIFPQSIIEIYNKLKEARSTPYVLMASTIELAITGAVDMLTGESASREGETCYWGLSQGSKIQVNVSSNPPKAIGQSCIVLNDESDILKIFQAISSRNTAGTEMNDSSSRSHCFAWLTLFALDPATDKVQTSRFQFVDLAGKKGTEISFRKYIGELVPLLSESLTGTAPSLIIVCLSQAPANVMQCKFALDFGATFNKLIVNFKKPKFVNIQSIEKKATEAKETAEGALARSQAQSKTRSLREAQIVDADYLLMVVEMLRS
ncbi:hypothetical protein TrLO_g15753 [Triparma laevis f. longispina]|uniref:Kinesin motor domain-containing protein n=1 Tax=Triparma laevis f. longispina TaxID=1714387 RepID=A0A9W7EJ22_9STRA|nr:hypothetical protein TrLO_g15753 [Triparma laevis f. longispina]